MNSFRQAILVPREVIEAGPEVMPAIIKAAQKAGVDWAEMLIDGGSRDLVEATANAGRHGDTELAHVTPEEGQMLEAMGGAGTTNPTTGLKEYYRPDVGRDDVGGRGIGGQSGGIGGGEGGNEGTASQSSGSVSRSAQTGSAPPSGSSIGTMGAPPSSGPGGPGYGPSPSGPQGAPGPSTNQPQTTVTPTQAAGNYPGALAGATRSIDPTVEGAEWVDSQGRKWRSTGPAGLNWAGVLGGVALPGPLGFMANEAGAEAGLENIVDLGYGRVQIDPVTGAHIVEGGPGASTDNRVLRGGFPVATFAPPGQQYSRPSAMTPSERFGFETGMSPFQQRIAIASRGTSGLDSFFRSQEAMNYYRNLLQRALITEGGTLGDIGQEVRPIESAYMDLMGLPPRTSTEGLLEALAGA